MDYFDTLAPNTGLNLAVNGVFGIRGLKTSAYFRSGAQHGVLEIDQNDGKAARASQAETAAMAMIETCYRACLADGVITHDFDKRAFIMSTALVSRRVGGLRYFVVCYTTLTEQRHVDGAEATLATALAAAPLVGDQEPQDSTTVH